MSWMRSAIGFEASGDVVGELGVDPAGFDGGDWDHRAAELDAE